MPKPEKENKKRADLVVHKCRPVIVALSGCKRLCPDNPQSLAVEFVNLLCQRPLRNRRDAFDPGLPKTARCLLLFHLSYHLLSNVEKKGKGSLRRLVSIA